MHYFAAMNLSLQSKLPNIGTTIFTTMSVLAAQNNAINLGQGFPDFPMSEELVALVAQAMAEPLKFLTANAALKNYSELVEVAGTSTS